MATFPTYVDIAWADTAEQPASVVMRSEMERSVPKQRRMASDTMVTVPVTLYFRTKQNATDFEDWVYTQIGGGADWFAWTNPRTGATVQARIVGGDIGALKPGSRAWTFAERSLQLEYLRSAY
jgi:hypothetical protein